MGKHNGMNLLDFDHVMAISKYSRKCGFTLHDYDKMIRRQNYKCACCGSEKAYQNGSMRFHVDHDHTTGKIRGLLCTKCNKGIGLLGDTTEGLLKAVEYLRQSETLPDIRNVPEESLPKRRKQAAKVYVRFLKRDKKYCVKYIDPHTLERVERVLKTQDAEEALAVGKRLEERLNKGRGPDDLAWWLYRTGQAVSKHRALVDSAEVA